MAIRKRCLEEGLVVGFGRVGAVDVGAGSGFEFRIRFRLDLAVDL